MKKRTVRERAIERAKWSEVFKEGFEHGYQMGFDQGQKKGSGLIDNQVDKVDRQDNQIETWGHQAIQEII